MESIGVERWGESGTLETRPTINMFSAVQRGNSDLDFTSLHDSCSPANGGSLS